MRLKLIRDQIFFVGVFWFGSMVAVNSDLNYTGSQTGFISANRIFKLNESARGFIRFNRGFTVKPDARVSLDVPIPILGPLDLRNTGTVRLISDLIFDASVTLTGGGRIDGNNHKITLNGDFTIPASKTLHINGNTIIDGKGFSLICSSSSQIFVDTAITLTLCNMTITNKPYSPMFPPIRCGAQTSKLALSNVVLRPTGDFWFPQGQLFVHNDVIFTGTSAFIYMSPMPSFVTAGSCLYFDQGTTFSVVPSTFTENNTYTSNKFIQFADATASLYCNGCSLCTTPTGCRFTNGNILFDNNIICKSDTTITMTSISLRSTIAWGGASASVGGVKWSPDGKFLAVGGNQPTSGNEVAVYSFNGTTFTLVSQISVGGVSSNAITVDWSPDGRYLAIGCYYPTTYQLQVYSFYGYSLSASPVAQANYTDYGIDACVVRSVNWSPDGNYLAVSGYISSSGYQVRVYKFNGSSLIQAAQHAYGSEVMSVHWSPDGNYLALGGRVPSNNSELQVCSFNGSSLTLVAHLDYGVAGTAKVWSVNWSPDGRFLAIGGSGPSDGNQVKIYRFYRGLALVLVTQMAYGNASSIVYSATWSPCGCYLALGGSGPTSGYEVQVYGFNGSALSASPVGQVNYGIDATAFVYGMHWRPDGNFLALGGYTSTVGHYQCEAYRCDFVRSTVPQAYSKGIVFGDSRYGVSSDAMVTLMASARVDLTGKMSYDNFGG